MRKSFIVILLTFIKISVNGYQ